MSTFKYIADLEAELARIYKIVDDIDTLSDIHKPDNKSSYVQGVYKQVKKLNEGGVCSPDGHCITFQHKVIAGTPVSPDQPELPLEPSYSPDLSRLRSLDLAQPVFSINTTEFEMLKRGKPIQVGSPDDTFRTGLMSHIALHLGGKIIQDTVNIEDNGYAYLDE
jgi:hypothetical protein